jgi:hypothetical protein
VSATDSRVTLIELADDDLPQPSPSKKPRTSSPRTPKPFKIEYEEHERHPEPKRWREAHDIIAEQRKTIVAPVDLMGCTEAGKLEDDAQRGDTDPRSRRYQTLTSLMLSSSVSRPLHTTRLICIQADQGPRHGGGDVQRVCFLISKGDG